MSDNNDGPIYSMLSGKVGYCDPSCNAGNCECDASCRESLGLPSCVTHLNRSWQVSGYASYDACAQIFIDNEMDPCDCCSCLVNRGDLYDHPGC